MFKNRSLIDALVFAAVATFFLITCCNLLHAKAPAVSATVQFSDGSTTTVTDFSEPVGIQPNELVNITIQFGPDAIGGPVIVEAIHGGPTSVGSSIPVIGADGTLSFTFLAPAHPGAKTIGSTSFLLQFSVVNANRP